jgi:high-affinity iron transporter
MFEYSSLLTFIALTAILAFSYYAVLIAGQLSLAQVGLASLAAFTSSLVVPDEPLFGFIPPLLIGVVFGMAVGVIAAFVLGLPIMRLRGVFLAIAMSLFVGAGLQMASAGFPQRTQELIEAAIALVAVGVLVGMVFWMRRAARSIRTELHASVDAALDHRGGWAVWALIGRVFLAVAREGLESVFFLLAILQQSSDGAAPLGAGLVSLVSAGAGWAIYAGALRLNLRRFFRWTGVFVLFVAAGLFAGALRALHEAGL